jgi:hypothetical protein
MSMIWGGCELCWGDVVGGEFNKLCCVLRYCAIGVGMFWMGRCDSDPASNGEACGER